jgi:hypothetical protein
MATKRTLDSEDIEQELALESESDDITGDLREEGTRTFTCSLDPPEA